MSILKSSLPYIRTIAPYLPGKPITALAREFNIPVKGIIKLASNENPVGMSPKVRATIMSAMDECARYPDPHDLITALANFYEIPPQEIVLGNGSNDVLDLAARVFLNGESSAVYAEHSFAVYQLATQCTGAASIVVPANHFGHDLAAMLAAIRSDTKLIWIANPNNPTGTYLSNAKIHDFVRSVPSNVVVVLDEAYEEYLPQPERGSTMQWRSDYPNLIITRTFSKIYGLAGLRIGYALTSVDIADLMNRVRQPFNVGTLAIKAAIVALEDQDFVQRSQEINQLGKDQLHAGLAKLGLAALPAYGNFITFAVTDAASVHQKLLQQGVIVRSLGAYQMPHYLRVTAGLAAENEHFLHALAQSLST